jgi:hypothetical protein
VSTYADKIAGNGADATVLELSRAAAQAEFDLAQIRRVRVVLINRMLDFGEFEVQNPLGTFSSIKRIFNLIDRCLPSDLNAPAPPQLPSFRTRAIR